VTILVAGVLPAALVAVRVKVVVLAGQTLTLPLTGLAPTPGLMLRDVAPEVDQFKVEQLPALMLAGVAVKLCTVGGLAGGGGADVTVTVNGRLTAPHELLAVRT
jgi:hypothetical protein